MNKLFSTVLTWIKANLWLSIGIGIALLLVLFPKVSRGLFKSRRRVHHRTRLRVVSRRRRTLPRSVGMRRKTGAKRAWQVKGSLAARRHMAQIRRRRRA